MNMLRIAAAAAAVALATPSHAAVTIYTSEASFIAALGGTTVLEDFNDGTLAAPLASIVSTNGGFQGNHFEDVVNTTTARTTFNFAAPIVGFGGFFNLSPGGADLGIAPLLDGTTALGAGTAFEVPNGSGLDDFWGFVSTIPFTSVTLIGGTQTGNQNAELYHLDNLRFGAASTPAVPEPATWAMMLVGFGAIGWTMRRRRKNVTVAA